MAICRTFLLSVLTAFIARNLQIATAGRMGESACFAGLFWTSMAARSVRSVFYELLRRLRCSPELMGEAGIGVIPMPAPNFPAETWSRSAE